MAILSAAARNASLDNDYGPTRGPAAPAAHEVALFVGDPLAGGLEVSAAGYSRPVLFSDTGWAPAEAGSKSTAEAIVFPTADDSWGVVTHWCLFDADDHVTGWDTSAFAVPLDLTSPGGVLILDAGALTIFYADNSDPDV